VIVGASLAGLRAAQAIRGAGHDRELVVVGDETHLPYTRPPLSKELLAGEQEPVDVELPLRDVEVTWRLGVKAVRLDLERRELVLDDGERLPFSKLLLATGCHARPWPDPSVEIAGLHTIRGVDDALALRTAFDAGPRVAIVGAGFIGCEVAATARKRGLEVTLVDVAPQPMPALGPELGRRCAALHAEHGVKLRLGVGVAAFEGDRRLEAVRLADGSRVEVEVGVVALGAVPNTAWLRDSGLSLEPGVVCDADLAAVGAEDVFCAGDIVAWPHPLAGGELVRIEHWTNAAEQGAAAGRNLVAAPEERRPYDAVPYFWSDQYDVKMQSVGLPVRAQRVRMLEASPDGSKWVAGGEEDGRLVCAVGFGAARRLPRYRAWLAQRPPLEEVARAVEADPKSLGPVPAEAADEGVAREPALEREEV
jgi:NADPH-dependent 2,4-dienoyl-CoA reductase/sulfur reductase-like enzyme